MLTTDLVINTTKISKHVNKFAMTYTYLGDPSKSKMLSTSWINSVSVQHSNPLTSSASAKPFLNKQTKVRKMGDNPWNLKGNHWSLKKAAANYYMLTLCNLLDDKFEPFLNRHTDILVDQFSRYTDMVVGGELRHTQHTQGMPNKLKQALKDNTLLGPKSSSRHGAWEGWYWFRSRYGVLATQWAVDAYNDETKWSKGYGGKPWANIANTLCMFERDQITPHSFVDTCWGLQHNGGVYFNKWWDTSGLKHVLDLNQAGWYCQLIDYTSWSTRGVIATKPNLELIKSACICTQCELKRVKEWS